MAACLATLTMSLRFILSLALLVALTKARPEKHVKECKDDDDCAPGFTCMQGKRFKTPICARKKTEKDIIKAKDIISHEDNNIKSYGSYEGMRPRCSKSKQTNCDDGLALAYSGTYNDDEGHPDEEYADGYFDDYHDRYRDADPDGEYGDLDGKSKSSGETSPEEEVHTSEEDEGHAEDEESHDDYEDHTDQGGLHSDNTDSNISGEDEDENAEYGEDHTDVNPSISDSSMWIQPRFCKGPPVHGTRTCRMSIPSFTFNSTQGRCVPYIYGGCRATKNRFDTNDECQKECDQYHPDNNDYLEIDDENAEYGEDHTDVNPSLSASSMWIQPLFCQGPPRRLHEAECLAYMPRFTFNSTQGQCVPYIYGGCGATKNLFDTKDECQKECDQDLPDNDDTHGGGTLDFPEEGSGDSYSYPFEGMSSSEIEAENYPEGMSSSETLDKWTNDVPISEEAAEYPDDLAEPDNYQDPMLDEGMSIPGAHIPIDEPIDEVDLDEPMDNAYGDMENSECSDKIQRILRKAKDKLSDQHSVAMQAYEMLKEILEEEEELETIF